MGYKVLTPPKNAGGKGRIHEERFITVGKHNIMISAGLARFYGVKKGWSVVAMVNGDGNLCLDFKDGKFPGAFNVTVFTAKGSIYRHLFGGKRFIGAYGLQKGRYAVTGFDGWIAVTECKVRPAESGEKDL